MPSDNFTMSENSGSFGMQQRQDRFDAIADLIVGPPGPPGPQGEDAPDDYILVQTTQPTSETNAIWVDPSDQTEVVLATWADVIGLYPTNTASGDVAHFEDGANNIPIKRLTVNVEPIQDLHGYDSPWPAGGGKNKLPLQDYTAISNGITYTVTDDGKVIANGTSSEGVSAFYLYGNTGKSFPAGNYILSGCPSGGGTNTYSIRQVTNGTYVGQDSGNGRSLEIAQDDSIVFYIRIAQDVSVSNLVFEPMLRLASVTDATYAPYSNICPISGRTSATIYHSGADTSDPTTYTIQFGDTVYGGTLDVTGGKMLVLWKQYNLGAYNWSKTSGVWASDYLHNSADSTPIRNTNGVNTILSSAYNAFMNCSASYLRDNAPDQSVALASSNTRTYFILKDSRFTSATDLKSWLAESPDNGFVICQYRESFRPTITLTPTQIDTLHGTNNVWSDAGSVDVEYRADIGLFIQQKIAELNGG